MKGEQEFEEFFVSTYGGLLRTLTAVTGNAEMAADALQDAYQRAFVRWSKISRYDAPAAWVRRVAINRSRDLARSDSRRRANEERAADPELVVDEEVDVDNELLSLLRPLPERQRTAMALFYLDALSIDQVAEAMNISSGAVKYHLNQGREKLRPLLEQRDPQ